ncbi:MAG TPA: flagellin [Allosphingosinicella sp.]|jgi:flagellar hook-associated protein 3 FlgL
MITGTRYQLQLEVNRQLRLSTEIARAQAEISTGKRILAASDDPVGAARISEIGRNQANQETWRTNLDTAVALSATADDVLTAVGIAIDRANELMLRASNGTMSADNRNAIALELSSIAEEVAVLRDTRDSRGEPLFPTSTALRIPVGAGLDISAVGTRAAVFDTIAIPSGSSDLVSILAGAAAAVRANDPAAIATALGATNAAGSHIISARGEQGARGSRIDTLLDRLEDTALGLKEQRSAIESTDVMDAVARIQAKELSLEAAQAVFARINRSSLFDLLS